MATVFSVEGPIEVPTYQGRAGRTITDDNVRQFWEANGELADGRGCYVFGIRAGKGLTPAYVGKATNSFKYEVFAHHKLTRYQQFLADYQKGTPVLFFVIAPTKRGTPNKTHIEELEKFLIQTGQAANPELLNIRGTKAEEWGIAGVLRGGKGKPSKRAREFRRLMKLLEPVPASKALDHGGPPPSAPPVAASNRGTGHSASDSPSK
jgi:hypothetical protein